MAMFPTFENSENVKTDFSLFYYDIKVPKLDFGKKLYKLSEGKLKAFIPVSLVMLQKEGYCESRYGELYVVCKEPNNPNLVARKWNNSLKYFNSVEDYNAFIDGDNSKEIKYGVFRNNVYGLCNALSQSGYNFKEHECWYRSISGYVADKGANPYKTDMTINKMWIDVDGIHIDFVDDGKRFLTYEEALKASRVTNIEDFNDTENDVVPKVFKIDVSLRITATTEEVANQRAKEILSKLQ